MEKLNFDEFVNSSFEDWYKSAEKELKNVTIGSLSWMSYEDIEWQPYYDQTIIENLPLNEIQAVQKKGTDWKNMVEVKIVAHPNFEKETNQKITALIENGAETILLDLMAFDNLEEVNFSKILLNCNLTVTPFYFKTTQKQVLLKILSNLFPYQIQGGILGKECFYEELPFDFENDWSKKSNLIKFKLNYLSANDVHFKGGNVIQENAFLLSKLVACLDNFSNDATQLSNFCKQLLIEVPAKIDYFLTIAQLRSLRFLLSKVFASYNITTSPTILCTTSLFYQTQMSPYTNILRTTTQAMSAAIGGADLINVLSFNVVENSTELSERIARNISIILKEESYITATSDASAGAYFMEWLTYQICRLSWEKFLEIEPVTEIDNMTKLQTFWEEIASVNQRRIADLKSGKVMVGVTKFVVEGDKIDDNLVVNRLEKALN